MESSEETKVIISMNRYERLMNRIDELDKECESLAQKTSEFEAECSRLKSENLELRTSIRKGKR